MYVYKIEDGSYQTNCNGMICKTIGSALETLITYIAEEEPNCLVSLHCNLENVKIIKANEGEIEIKKVKVVE